MKEIWEGGGGRERKGEKKDKEREGDEKEKREEGKDQRNIDEEESGTREFEGKVKQEKEQTDRQTERQTDRRTPAPKVPKH